MPTSDITNNSFTTATRLTGINNAPQGGIDQVLNRTDNTLDFYRFTTSGSSNLRINLTGITGDVQLSLYRVTSDVTPTEADRVTLRTGSTGRLAESYTSTSDPALADVAPGIYYIKVEQAGIALPSSTYSLGVFASTTQDTISALWRNPNGGLDAWQLSGNTIDAKGVFSPTDAPATLQLISSGDFNADGIDDLLWKDSVKNTFVLWFMENGTVRKSSVEIQDSTGLSYKRSSDWAVAGLDDIDKDGFTDILLRNQTSGEIDAWFMNEERVTKAVAIANGFRVYAEWQIAGFANSRVLWRNINTDAVVTWDLNQNGLAQGAQVSSPVSQNWQVVAFQDFNNDGVADVMWRNTQEQKIVFWRLSSTNNNSSGAFDLIADGRAYSVRNDFKLSTIADFNGDKRPDILFWDPKTGEIVTWEINQNGVDITGSLVTFRQNNNEVLNSKDDRFDVILAKDFDGDQKADILWRNKNDNATVFWKMNGSVLERASELQPAPAPVPVGAVLSGIDYPGFKSVSSLKATTKKQPQFTAGTSRLNSFDLGVLDGSGSFLDTIGGTALATDRQDWYKFKVETPSLLTGLSLAGANIGNAKVEVYADRGSLSNTALTATELLAVFQAGTYYLKVTPDTTKQSIRTPYTLNVTGRLGITNLKANSVTLGSTTSIALDIDPTKNKVTVTALEIENNGDFASNNPVSVGYYLSRDGVFDATDRRLTLATEGTSFGIVARGIAEKVNPNGTITVGTPNKVSKSGNPLITLTLPGANDAFWSQSGATYQIIAVVDPDKLVTNEKDTSRNDNWVASTTSITVTKAGGLDLTGNGLTSTVTSVSKTGIVSGSFTIKNDGGVPLAAGQSLKVKFYFSKDVIISSNSDLFIGEVTITSAIAAGGTLNQNFSFTLPTNDDATNYWVDNKPATSTQLQGYVGMFIDTVGSNIIDTNVPNNSSQGLTKDLVALTVTGL